MTEEEKGESKNLTLLERIMSFFVGAAQSTTSHFQHPPHPLLDKVGFKLCGKLEDGRDVCYEVGSDCSRNPVAETVRLSGKDRAGVFLTDYDHDGLVDQIFLGGQIPSPQRTQGKIQFDPRYFTDEQTREMFASADAVFREVTSWEALLQKRGAYSCRIQGNLLAPPERESQIEDRKSA